LAIADAADPRSAYLVTPKAYVWPILVCRLGPSIWEGPTNLPMRFGWQQFWVTTYLTQHRAPTLKRPSDLDKHGFYSPHAWTRKQLANFASQLGGIDLGIVRTVKVLHDAGVENVRVLPGRQRPCLPRRHRAFRRRPLGWMEGIVCVPELRLSCS
jgi:hypothetical protein